MLDNTAVVSPFMFTARQLDFQPCSWLFIATLIYLQGASDNEMPAAVPSETRQEPKLEVPYSTTSVASQCICQFVFLPRLP